MFKSIIKSWFVSNAPKTKSTSARRSGLSLEGLEARWTPSASPLQATLASPVNLQAQVQTMVPSREIVRTQAPAMSVQLSVSQNQQELARRLETVSQTPQLSAKLEALKQEAAKQEAVKVTPPKQGQINVSTPTTVAPVATPTTVQSTRLS